MDLEAQRLNYRGTYRYPNVARLISGVYFLFCLGLAIWCIYIARYWLTASFFCYSIGGAALFLAYIRYRVNVSRLGISLRAWKNEPFIAWKDIQSLQFDFRKDCLRIKDAHKTSLQIAFAIHGYDEIWEILGSERPDLLKTLPLRQFHGRKLSPFVIGMAMFFFIGTVGLSGEPSRTSAAAFAYEACLFAGLALLIYIMLSKKSIRLGKEDLMISYPLTKEQIPLAEISGVMKGKGLLMRDAKVIRLGKVREGQAALYDSLLEWWRASRQAAPPGEGERNL